MSACGLTDWGRGYSKYKQLYIFDFLLNFILFMLVLVQKISVLLGMMPSKYSKELERALPSSTA